MDTADSYAKFAALEARGQSPCYQQWADGVAADPVLLELLDHLPLPKRQPNLLFAAARYAGVVPPGGCGFAEFREAVLAAWPQVSHVMMTHRTQTNEVGRCAPALTLLATLPRPLALLEVGASAGLCLYPDKFSYAYGDRPRVDPPAGPGAAILRCGISGPVPVPATVPEVVWRAGIDLNPLLVADPEHMRWLRSLVWPEHDARRARLATAIAVARADPPRLVAGDLNDHVAELASQAPTGATLVIFHTSVLAYLHPADRARFTATVAGLPCRWICAEAPGVVRFADGALPPSPEPGRALSVLAIDGRPVGYAAPHGQSLHWFARS